MTTYSVPFYRNPGGERKLAGIITADVSLTRLEDIVDTIKTGGAGYAFLVSRNGTFIAHPKRELVMNETIFSVAEEREDPAIRHLGKLMVKGNDDFIREQNFLNNEKSLIIYDHIASSGWSLGIVFPLKALEKDGKTLKLKMEIIGIIGFILVFVVIITISRSITMPLTVLARTTAEIAKGNLDFQLPPFKTHDEVGTLADMFISMRDSLKLHIEELTKATAARQKMESELRIAHDIQMNMVPRTFPPFPGRKELDIVAFLKPAKEVGGDFYDFFFINENHLLVVLGDISGKGVPAALLMARIMTLIKTEARGSQECEDIMSLVNREFSLNNDECMFATTFLAILNTDNGELSFCNGGHNSPLFIEESGHVEFIKKAGSPPVGIDEDSLFKRDMLIMKPGDALLMYTDGVTEAFNEHSEIFGNERLKEVVTLQKKRDLPDLVEKVIQAVESFAGKQEQSDDITIQVLLYRGTK
jgi:sigma-B regulation protein RsbU (phosphoserine phosphatase)